MIGIKKITGNQIININNLFDVKKNNIYIYINILLGNQLSIAL